MVTIRFKDIHFEEPTSPDSDAKFIELTADKAKKIISPSLKTGIDLKKNSVFSSGKVVLSILARKALAKVHRIHIFIQKGEWIHNRDVFDAIEKTINQINLPKGNPGDPECELIKKALNDLKIVCEKMKKGGTNKKRVENFITTISGKLDSYPTKPLPNLIEKNHFKPHSEIIPEQKKGPHLDKAEYLTELSEKTSDQEFFSKNQEFSKKAESQKPHSQKPESQESETQESFYQESSEEPGDQVLDKQKQHVQEKSETPEQNPLNSANSQKLASVAKDNDFQSNREEVFEVATAKDVETAKNLKLLISEKSQEETIEYEEKEADPSRLSLQNLEEIFIETSGTIKSEDLITKEFSIIQDLSSQEEVIVGIAEKQLNVTVASSEDEQKELSGMVNKGYIFQASFRKILLAVGGLFGLWKASSAINWSGSNQETVLTPQEAFQIPQEAFLTPSELHELLVFAKDHSDFHILDTSNIQMHQILDILNKPNKGGYTLLHKAVQDKNHSVVLSLLKLGANANLKDPKGQIALTAALAKKLPNKLIEELIEKTDSELFLQADRPNFPIKLAIENGYFEVLEQMCTFESVTNQFSTNRSLTQEIFKLATKDESNAALLILSKYVPPKVFFSIFNTPDSYGVGLLDKAMREGNIERVNLVISASDEAEIMAHPEVFISQDTIDGCLANTEFQKIIDLPLEEISFPLNISQSFCDTNLRLANGGILRLKNTNATQVFSYLMEKKHDIKDAKYHEFTTFLSPEHSFFKIKGHREAKGFSPDPDLITEKNQGIFARLHQQQGKIWNDAHYEKRSDQKNHLKVKFLLDDAQIKKVKSHFNAKAQSCEAKGDDGCTYQFLTRNCVDFVQELFEAADGQGHFADFLTVEQLGSFQTLSRGYTSVWESKAQEYALLRSRGEIKYLGESSKLAINYGLQVAWSTVEKLPLIESMQNLTQSNWQSSDLTQFVKRNDPKTLIELAIVCTKIGVSFAKGVYGRWNLYQGEIVKKEEADLRLTNAKKNIEELNQKSQELRGEIPIRFKKKHLEEWKKLSDLLVEADFMLIELEDQHSSLARRTAIRENSLKEIDNKIKDVKSKIKEVEDELLISNKQLRKVKKQKRKR